MICAVHLLSVSSTLFRVLSFIFLRVIPLPICKTALPVLYTTYAALLLLTPRPVRQFPPGTAVRQHLERKGIKKNGAERSTQSPVQSICKFVCTFILTLPSPSVNLRNLSLLTNTALLLFAVDLITHPIRYPAHDAVFARIGAVDHNSVKLSVRYPQDDSAGIKVVFRSLMINASDEAGWTDGPSVELFKENDWTGSATISNLWPSTIYEYKLAPLNSSHDLPYPATPLQFRTFPDPRFATGSHFKFIATSCILPNFPYVPGKGDRIKGFELLAEYLSAEEARSKAVSAHPRSSDKTFHLRDPSHSAAPLPRESNQLNGDKASSSDKALSTEFLLLLGDFVYADVLVYFGDSEEAYRRLYRRTYASPSFRKIYERLPILHIYDDHEIINNFAGKANDSTRPFPSASSAFDLYNAQANYDSRHKGQYYYDFRYGDVAFFVLDTRRYRSSASDANVKYSTMLGTQQLETLQSWLAEVNQTSTFKFIVSSVPFTTLWQHDAQTDSWAAFKRERSILLESLHTVPNLFILSGDRHEFAAIEFNGPFDWSRTIFEFSTSPLNMFYVPLIRTLSMESSQHVERTHQHLQSSSEGGGQTLSKETFLLPEERVLKYLPIGNHKWSSFEVDTRDPSRPVIAIEVVIDGQLAYSWSTVGAPVSLKKSTALSLLVPQSLHGVLDKFGLGSRKWF